MCDKQPYPNRDAATKAASGVSKKIKQGFHVYWCHYHQAYHLVSIRKKKLIPFKNFKYPFKLFNYALS